jgi:thiamine-monophosphate kinase
MTRQFRSSNLPLRFDDDVAAYPVSKNEWLILKTDMFVGSTDIPNGMKVWQAARKAVVATVSDFASKGIRPHVIMLSLGLPSNITRSTVHQLAIGFRKGAEEYGCKVIGGDTGTAKDLVFDIVGSGFARPSEIMRRRGAKPGDIIVATGMFGKTAAGLRILSSNRKTSFRRKYHTLLTSVLNPKARLKIGVLLGKSHAVTSSIDSSDGLAWSLHLLAQLNKVNIKIDHVPIPNDVYRFANETSLDPLDLALYGGEEYEIIASVKPNQCQLLEQKIRSLVRIGTVESGNGQVILSTDHSEKVVEAKGWDPFRNS